jgi:hypothetical protein
MLSFETLINSFTSWDISQLTGFLLMTVTFGGIPYLIFLVGFYRWIKDKNKNQIPLDKLFPKL